MLSLTLKSFVATPVVYIISPSKPLDAILHFTLRDNWLPAVPTTAV